MALSGPSRMLQRQTTRPNIWTLCPPRHHSFFEAIFPPSSHAQSDRPRQLSNNGTLKSIMTTDIMALQTRSQTVDNDP
ncbi:hypothetical protein TNCV_2079291 [Trichonephila clavipes]|nr:hypothetical protein TNCV_2079291 [Trichonephila clavipes]